MRVDLYGLNIETPRVTCYLWSPWRASALEHRMFDAVRHLPGLTLEEEADEVRVHLADVKSWKAAHTGIVRVLKGWQEEADQGRERRSWRWLLEGDTDDHGYDHASEPFGLWVFIRLSVDRGSLEEGEKGEDIDLNGFGLRFCPTTGK